MNRNRGRKKEKQTESVEQKVHVEEVEVSAASSDVKAKYPRLLDRKSYSQRTISTYSVVSAYIIDIYYNHLYNEAIKFKNSGKVQSITEGYKHAIFAFIQTIDPKSSKYNPKYYMTFMNGVKEWFTIHTSFSTLSLADCIDKIMMEFIPEDFYDNVDKDSKRNTLRGILIRTIVEFSDFIVKEFLPYIIDQHDDTANIEVLKEKMIDILLIERESVFQTFLNPNVTESRKEKIDKSIAIRMQEEIKKNIQEIYELKSKLGQCENIINKQEYDLMNIREQCQRVIKMARGYKELYEKEKNKRIEQLENMQMAQVQAQSQAQAQLARTALSNVTSNGISNDALNTAMSNTASNNISNYTNIPNNNTSNYANTSSLINGQGTRALPSNQITGGATQSTPSAPPLSPSRESADLGLRDSDLPNTKSSILEDFDFALSRRRRAARRRRERNAEELKHMLNLSSARSAATNSNIGQKGTTDTTGQNSVNGSNTAGINVGTATNLTPASAAVSNMMTALNSTPTETQPNPSTAYNRQIEITSQESEFTEKNNSFKEGALSNELPKNTLGTAPDIEADF